ISMVDYTTENQRQKDKADNTDDMSMVVPQKRKLSCKGLSTPKSMKIRNEESMGDETKKNVLKRPECDYHTRSAHSWSKHLKNEHLTTPTLAGCLLR
ncbi:hypothetical protein PMAYCL1PPCAC_13960, partial [Pristionchus mayeri]